MQAAPDRNAPPDPGIIFAMVNAHQQTAALNTAIELNLFGALTQGPADAAAIAQHCSASSKGMRVLCDFLVICGLLQKDGSLYSHTPTSAVFLDPARLPRWPPSRAS